MVPGRNRTTDTAIFSEPDYRFKPLQIGSFCPPKNGDIVSRTAQALSDRFTLFHIRFRVWFPIGTQPSLLKASKVSMPCRVPALRRSPDDRCMPLVVG